MILLLDNYDSFVYNLARYIEVLGFDIAVYRSDALTVDDINRLNPKAIVISPGPCTPNEAGVSLAAIRAFGHRLPILGICLGHQAIGQAFGAEVTKAKYPIHGKARKINHNQEGIFSGLENPMLVARYHSLIVSKENFPDELLITSYSEEGEIMSLQHKSYNICGFQFHPESVLTQHGLALLRNFFYSAFSETEDIRSTSKIQAELVI